MAFDQELEITDTDPAAQLSPEETLVAFYEATCRFKTLSELAQGCGRGIVWLSKVRKKEAYRVEVKRILIDLKQRLLDRAAQYEELFNQEIVPSLNTVVALRDDLDQKGDVRLKAAFGLLDRAPDSPQVRQANDIQRVPTIIIGQDQFNTIKNALTETGQQALLDLLPAENSTPTESQESSDENPPSQA